MEAVMKKGRIDRPRLMPQPWPKRPNLGNHHRPFPMMASSSLPSAPSSSFQLLKQPYLKSHGNVIGTSSSSGDATIRASSSSSPLLSPDDKKTTNRHHDDEDKTTQTDPSPPSEDKNLDDHHDDGDQITSSGDDSVKADPGSSTDAGGSSRRKLDYENMDPKNLRRILSNRLSAQRSRMKKVQYVTNMERKAKDLEVEIAKLHPQLEVYRKNHESLQREQRRLNHRIITFANNSIMINAEIEENKAEVTRLRQLHLSQQQKLLGHGMTRMRVWESGFEQMMNPNLPRPAGERMVFANPNQGQYGENTEELMNMQKQLKMNEVAAQFDDRSVGAETNMIVLDWGTARAEQMPNPILASSEHLEKANMNLRNLNLGGIEQIISLNNNMFQNP